MHEYGVREFGEAINPEEMVFVVRDTLTELRHICDMHAIDYGATDTMA